MSDIPDITKPLDLSVRISTDEWNALADRPGVIVPVTDDWVTDADSPAIIPGSHSVQNTIDTTEAPFTDLSTADTKTVHAFLGRITNAWGEHPNTTYRIKVTIDPSRWNEDSVGAALQHAGATAILEHLNITVD